MSYETEREVLETHFLENWPETEIDWENVEASPELEADKQAGSPWVRFTIQNGQAFAAAIGGDPLMYRSPGVVFVQVFTKSGIGTAIGAGLADKVAAIFRGKRLTGGIHCQAPTVTRIGRDGSWFQFNVSIPFYRDEVE